MDTHKLLEPLHTVNNAPVSSQLEGQQVPDAWSFMLPWCDYVRDRVVYQGGEFSDPPGLSGDKNGVLNIKYVVPEEFDGEFPAPFLLGLPYGKRAPTDDYESLVRGRFVHDTKPEDVLRGDLVFFCGVEQHTRRSKEYDAALTKIIGIWRESQQELGDVPDEIEVPIAIQVSPAVARYGGGMITYVQNVLKAICDLYLFDPT
ncbi:hypothetical protein PC118_g23476 [Phytophthora cactorum]|uniref:Uncharacterized protein n=1 Tax=Phytophthora cactorum TaxID=29920 RepID=A0A8T1ETP8_9STRA|nr:hypothetical protein PC111_g22328 [Phytophthora cactorum]KAG2814142.1 hypothetical protein PC113_g23350 [Phytophthora cactorum]KAG2958540.1 hypothetical protein PC118_g23476 [Phytophthora cactorum]KAG2962457.1 hypothetical protein PC119_g25805 [Phytophthora cactorum]